MLCTLELGKITIKISITKFVTQIFQRKFVLIVTKEVNKTPILYVKEQFSIQR